MKTSVHLLITVLIVVLFSLESVLADGLPFPEDMVFIPGGTFQMGDSFNEGGTDEQPVHEVTVDSFVIGKYEITNQQYCDFLNSALSQGLIIVRDGLVWGTSMPVYCYTSTSSSYSQIDYSGGLFSVRTKGGRNMSNDPMVCVTWYGSVAYCNWRSQQEGKEQCYNLSTSNCDFNKHGYRLPTEAEWEYAARGGLSGKRFPWGDTISHSRANYYSYWSGGHPYYPYDVSPTEGSHPTWNDGIYPYTSPVDYFSKNGYGIYDMAGNVMEWCNDKYSSSYYSSSPMCNPTGPTSSSNFCRVFRGGGWDICAGLAYGCRVACRYNINLGYAGFSIGFRVVLSEDKEFMITFDDGPVPGNTAKIVNALKNIYVGCEPVKAGFFMIGEQVRENPDVVKDVNDANHFIGDHTQHHPDFNGWFHDWSVEEIMLEISQCYDEIKKALDPNEPNKVNLRKIFRPPLLSVNPNVVKAADNLDFQIILGAGENEDKTTEDWVGWSPKVVKEKASNLIQSWHRDYPCVLVFHDRTSAALNITEIVEYLVKKKGFTLVHFDPSRLPGSLPSLVHQDTNTIHQSETVTHTVSLDSTVSTATFNVSWGGSDLDLVLYKPDGTKIDPNSTLVDPNIKYAERDTYEYYTVSDPNPGNWIMEVSSVNVPPMGEKYTIRVEADTNLALFAFTDKPEYGLNEDINIGAQLVNDENSVTGALVTAKVHRPDGSIDNLVLYDDGEHGDKDPNDGFYANDYNNISLRGLYEITVSAIGELTGEQYERGSSLTIMVGSIIYGNVDFGAYAILANRWLDQNCAEPVWCDTADLDQSGQVDISDLSKLALNWLEGDLCPYDPNKTEPGYCGCGVPDIDVDSNGIPDCGFKYGDVDGNGEVTAYDAALTSQCSETLTDIQRFAADVDGNGCVSAEDADLIAQYAVGSITVFPAELMNPKPTAVPTCGCP